MESGESIRLESSGAGSPLSELSEINEALRRVGSGVWPLDLSGAPAETRRLLDQRTLTDAEAETLEQHFLLPRERLLEIVARAGRQPHVGDGGSLTPYVTNHGYSYPQLYLVQGEVDYSRFDRFHVNVADDDTGTDEILQLLSGGDFVFQSRRPSGEILTLTLDCSDPNSGWLVTYDGATPHIGSLASAREGMKLLVQVIGAPRWALKYVEND